MKQFILNDKIISTGLPPGTVLLDFIRYQQQLKGTKIGCREGDCGACTVLVGSLEKGVLRYQSMTSCLLPIGNVEGKHIVTIEGLNLPGMLNPLQQAMADCGATQCGFCSPGFIVSLAGFCLSNKEATTENVIAAIDGNICRCTGYKSIERAAGIIATMMKERNGEDPISFVTSKKILPAYFSQIKEQLLNLEKEAAPLISFATAVGGGTDLYVQQPERLKHAVIRFLSDDPSLKGITREDNRCIIGSSVTISDLIYSDIILQAVPSFPHYAKLISSTPIRNMATVAGNIINASPIGDLTILLLALDAQLVLSNGVSTRELPLRKFYTGYKTFDKKPDELIIKTWFLLPDADTNIHFEKVSKRTHLDIASVNSASRFQMKGDIIENAGLSAGGVGPIPLFLHNTSTFLKGKKITESVIGNAIEIMRTEIKPISDARGTKEYKALLLEQQLMAHLMSLMKNHNKQELYAATENHISSPAAFSSMENIDTYSHVRGESVFLDDIPEVQDTLYALVFDSPVAHGKILSLNISEAMAVPGVVKIFTAKDIPGENQVGGILPDEVLLADTHVMYCGKPVALVIAETEDAARAAVKKIKLEIEPLPIITDPRKAMEKGELILPPRTFQLGDTSAAWKDCTTIIEGQTETGGQEHLYLETQGAYALPQENGNIRIYSSTQGPTGVQHGVAKVLGIPMHRVEVDTTRLGGGFGGKEEQATTWAALCALAAYILKRPVKYSLHRLDDMRMTGKRHPYTADFKIGLNNDLKIIAYEANYFQNAGATADLSPAIIERTLFHCTNSYFIPHIKATAYSCRTNLPTNTAFRGFGGPQAMFVIEAAIAKAADQLNVSAATIQEKNLLRTGDEFPYGQKATGEATESWKSADATFNIQQLQQEVDAYNASHKMHKKGLAVIPICFGISFTTTMFNQARSLVHIYTDGSVGISTGAVEMGQGVNTKLLQVVSSVFSINPVHIKVNSTNTYRIANTAPTAASAAADLNGKATATACAAILERLKQVAAEELNTTTKEIEIKNEWVFTAGKQTTWSWKKLVQAAFSRRINLSELAHYTPPGIYFDRKKEKGHPFAYHVYGTAIITATVDCLRGIYEFDSVKVVHDFGKSMNLLVDTGQCEGGIVQGIGWMTMEELLYGNDGKLLTNSLSTYKVPDIYAVPKEITIEPLETQDENLAVFNSKAVGEPPLMYGIGAYFALRNAVKAFNSSAIIPYQSPMTPEKVLMSLYS